MSETSDPRQAELGLDLARLLERQEDLQGASEAYRFALGHMAPADKAFAEAALGMGRVSERLGDLPEARAAYQQAVEHARSADDSVAAGAWLGLAGVLERLGDLPEARAAYQQAVEHARSADDSVAAGAWLGLAGVLERLGDLPEARAAYQNAIRSSAPRESAMARLALTKMEDRKADSSGFARQVREILVSERPSLRNTHTHTYAAEVLEALGRPHFYSWAIVDVSSRRSRRNRGYLLLVVDELDEGISGLAADNFALRGDQYKLDEDSRIAVIKYLAEYHPDVMLMVVVNHARNASRTRATFNVTKQQDEAAATKFARALVEALKNLARANPTGLYGDLADNLMNLRNRPSSDVYTLHMKYPADNRYPYNDPFLFQDAQQFGGPYSLHVNVDLYSSLLENLRHVLPGRHNPNPDRK
jgi:tetratricopeptide (TPR) repeat protein